MAEIIGYDAAGRAIKPGYLLVPLDMDGLIDSIPPPPWAAEGKGKSPGFVRLVQKNLSGNKWACRASEVVIHACRHHKPCDPEFIDWLEDNGVDVRGLQGRD